MNNFNKTPAQKINILCIEDDKDTCELISILFPEYKVVFAHSFNEAVSLLAERDFDLIITDNWLPDGSGLDICRKIRAASSFVPIVFASGVGQKSEIEKAVNAGANKYLVKPYEPMKLQEIVKELIENP
ncbi:MAG: response regulator transcription factor [Pyrinomonadaceae bacterium]